MQFNTNSLLAWVALATLIGSSSGAGFNNFNLKARHQSIHARHDANAVQKRAPEPVPAPQEPAVVVPSTTPGSNKRKRSDRKCPANKKNGSGTPVNNVASKPTDNGDDNKGDDNNKDDGPGANDQSGSSDPAPSNSGSRLDKIRGLYAFTGFVYSVDRCQSSGEIGSDFKEMAKNGARVVITFGYCPSKDSQSDWENVLKAAESANIDIIPLIHTLNYNGNTLDKVYSRGDKIAKAIIKHPDNVLGLSVGDEPLYDHDFGAPDKLAAEINSLKGQLKAAGLDIPMTISDMAYGWQSSGQKSSGSSVAKAVDFFAVNTFPYFGQSASWGGNEGAFNAFKKDIEFFESIADGKPILVTQTGWPSSTAQFKPNSGAIVANVGSEQAFWNLLNGHCSDYFKKKNLGWMWRSWDDSIAGWGVKGGNGLKFSIDGTKTSC